MRLDRKYQPELAASADTTRPNLQNLHLDVEKKKLIATNGHVMAVVPITDLDKSPGPCAKDTTGFVAPAVLKQARKVTPKEFGYMIVSAGKEHVFVDKSTMPRTDAGGAQFPPWEQVVPSYKEGDEGTITIGISAKYLLDMAKAIGADVRKNYQVAVTIALPSAKAKDKTILEPYVVTASGSEAFAIIMPCRT